MTLDAPPTASARRYLSSSLPSIYIESVFGEVPPWVTTHEVLRETVRWFPLEHGDEAMVFLEWYDPVLAAFVEHAGWPKIASSNPQMSDVRRAYRSFATTREPFVTRWLGGLEEVLDPTVSVIDNLAFHLDPELAPEPWVRMLLCWLGFHAAEDLRIDRARRVLAEIRPAAPDTGGRVRSLARTRGTRAGLQRLLDLAFPEKKFEVEHNATFTESDDPAWRPPPPPPPRITVRTEFELAADEDHATCRLIEAMRPLRVPCRLVTAGGARDIA